MLAGQKSFVAVPGEALIEFRDTLSDVLEHVEVEESNDRPPPQPRSREPREPRESRSSPVHEVLPSKEVRAGGKRFYFDVEQNDRGTFIKLSEVGNVVSLQYARVPHTQASLNKGARLSAFQRQSLFWNNVFAGSKYRQAQ
jgi:hypothetical protein